MRPILDVICALLDMVAMRRMEVVVLHVLQTSSRVQTAMQRAFYVKPTPIVVVEALLELVRLDFKVLQLMSAHPAAALVVLARTRRPQAMAIV